MQRVAVVASHPVQYQAPWFRALARACELTVFFCHRQDAAGQARAGFDTPFEWDVPLIAGYRHRWLVNRAAQPDVSRFAGCDTPELASLLTPASFDACIVSGWYLKSYLQAIRACWRANLPVLVRGDSQLATTRSPLVRQAKYLPYHWFLRRIDAHLYVGRANREYLRHYGVPDHRLFFVPHVVDNHFFAAGAQQARERGDARHIRLASGAGDGTTVFILAGKLNENKRPLDFLRALAAARQGGADVGGIVVGDGPLASASRTLAADLPVPLLLAGFRNQTEMPACLAAADCVVLPSLSETWGLVVNEAMACGMPAVVARSAGCAPDLVNEGRTGYTFEAGNVAALAARMQQVHERLSADREAFRAAVLATIGRYDIPAAVAGTLQAVEAVARPTRAGVHTTAAVTETVP